MGPISDRDRTAFELVTKAVRTNYTDEQLESMHKMAEEIRAIVADANRREQETISRAAGR
jgi:hypothetical protein